MSRLFNGGEVITVQRTIATESQATREDQPGASECANMTFARIRTSRQRRYYKLHMYFKKYRWDWRVIIGLHTMYCYGW